ncbi:MAG: hypothetical protein D6744_01795 [Planctomycetota bacterium]|nr:MAG: hypothetical protein D6744_01795 [Planctomycetota bacterium]
MKMLDRLWQGCGHCDGAAHCPYARELGADAQKPKTGVAALPIPLTAGVVFLLPLVCGIVGGWAVQDRLQPPSNVAGWWQAGGAAAGIAVGVVIARVLLFVIVRLRSCERRGET